MQRPRRQTLVILVVLAVAFVALLISLRRSGPADTRNVREGSRVVESDVEPGTVDVDRYAITYDVETYTDAGMTTSRDDIYVDRPFRSRVLSRSQTGGTQTVSAMGTVSVRGTAFFVAPGAADADQRPDVVLPEAEERGAAERRETRRVAGRDCQVFRLGDGAETGRIVSLEEADTYTDICVDVAGLVLEEATFDASDLVHRRIARSVDLSPGVPPKRTFDLAPPKDAPAEQIGSVQPLEDDSRLPGGDFWQPAEPLEGFTFEGRYAVVPPGQPGFTDIAARGNVITFVTEVWTRGPDVIAIDQGATRGSKPFEDDPTAPEIEAGDLGGGELLLSLRESEVRFLTGDVRFVRIRGNVAPDLLIDVAEDLEAVDGGPLRVRD